MLTNRELRLWVTAMRIEFQLDNPQTPLTGPTSETLFVRVYDKANIKLNGSDKREIISTYHKQYNVNP